VEYVLLISLIVIVCMASMTYFSGELNHDFSTIGSGLDVRP
jgi:Flp pilus assembly pilin Flp